LIKKLTEITGPEKEIIQKISMTLNLRGSTAYLKKENLVEIFV